MWSVKVNGDLYNAFDERIPANELSLCCYFNIGIDAEIGASKIIIHRYHILGFERRRTKSRLCNYIIYFFCGAAKVFSPNVSGRRIKEYINNVKYKPFNRR